MVGVGKITLVVTLFAGSCVSAAPTAKAGAPAWTSELSKRSSYRVERVAVPAIKPKNAATEVIKALNKFNLPVSDALTANSATFHQPKGNVKEVHHRKHHQKGGSGAAGSGSAISTGFSNGTATATSTGAGAVGTSTGAGATDESGDAANSPVNGDVEFVAPITVGGQQIVMDFDTGSSDLWLFSTSLSAQESVGHTLFDPAKSPTFKQLQGNSFTINFGDGSGASGNIVGTDTVNIGGASVANQAVELASQVSSTFVTDTASNGLVGFAFSSINAVQPQKQKTFFDSIQNDLALPVFTANLKHATAGAYEFGQIDSTAFKGNLTAAKVDNSQGFWQFQSNSFAVGNGNVQQNPTANPAIADTGTTLMLVDEAVAKAYYAQVHGAQLDPQQGLFSFPCDAQLQDFHVALGDNNLATIDKSLLNFQQVNGTDTCVGGIQSNGGGNLQIYGDVLFKAQFAAFNIQDNTVSFAPHA